MHTRLAGVKFTEQGATIYGIVTQMTRENITIRLSPGLIFHQALSPEAPAELTVVTKGATYVGMTRVVSHANDDLILGFSQPLSKVQRRNGQRCSCNLPVTFRTVRSDGSVGAWQDAQATDVSLGGICLMSGASVEVARQMELLFSLNVEGPVDRTQTRLVSDKGIQEGPIDDSLLKVIARVVRQHQAANGKFILGLEFIRVLPKDELRLLQFIGANTMIQLRQAA
jgi:c-di-GMP-binding flagellar brake protein YcgR